MKDDLQAAVELAGFFGDGSIKSISRVAEALSNEVFAIQTTEAKEFVLHIRPYSQRQLVANQEYISSCLENGELFTPTLVAAKNGDKYLCRGNEIITVSRKLPGAHPARLDCDLLRKLGRRLAIFHKDVSSPLPYKPSRYLFADDCQQWLIANGRYVREEEYDTLLRYVYLLSAVPLASMSRGIVHGDYHRNNILVAGDTVSVLDFEYSGQGYFLYDIARAAIDLCGNDTSFSWDKNAAFLEGYNSVRFLNYYERAYYKNALVYVSLALVLWFRSRGRADMADVFIGRVWSALKESDFQKSKK